MQRFIVILIFVLTGILGWMSFKVFRNLFPDTSIVRNEYPVVLYKGPKIPPEIEIQKHRPRGWTSLNEIPRAVQGAVLVSEDWAFFTHKGYDPVQIQEAIKEDLEHGKFKRGASTLTQQVVKNVFLSRDKTIVRKVKEFFLAVRLEKNVSKHRILEIYFNIAEWGEGVFGIRAAANHYFHKGPSQLTPKEGAFLAMLLPSPKRYSQSFKAKKLTRYASGTIRRILKNMGRAGYINEGELDLQLATSLPFEAQSAGEIPVQALEPEPDPDEVPAEEVPVGSATEEVQDSDAPPEE